MNILPAILAGGEGRRMGGAKPLRPWGEASLVVNALRLASAAGEAPILVLRRPDQAGELPARIVLDRPDVEGPLGGLAAALGEARRMGRDAVLTLPCDMPLLPADLGARLAERLEGEPRALAAAPRAGDQIHPVCALWRTGSLDRLEAYLASGRRSLHGFATACEALIVDWPQDCEPLFANANTPEELAQLAGAQRFAVTRIPPA